MGLRSSQESLDTLAGNSHAQEFSAFGEQLIAEITPVVQLQSAYNINTRIIEARDNNGASSISNNKFQVSTGSGANQSSQLLSRIAIKYNAGQGGLCRFTALYTTGVEGSTQYAGVGSSAEGYFFGYNGLSFGILQRQGGSPEVRTITVTTKSTTAEDITITLDGDAATDVTVSDATATDVTTTANEIATHDYSNVGSGWTAHAMGANLVFESYPAAVQTGDYSLSSASTAVGTFVQDVAGIAPTETFVAQEDWSEDQFLGDDDSTVLDTTKGNVYQIRYEWLGFGDISFYIEESSNGVFSLVHRIKYTNANTIPSIDNPTLPLCLAAKNTSNTSDIILQSSSMLGGIEGKDTQEGLFNAAILETTGITDTETPVLSIHNHTTYQSKINRVRIKLEDLTVSFDATAANKPAVVRVTLNPELTGASFASVDANTSVVKKDTSATVITGGIVLFSQSLAEGAASSLDLGKRNIKLNPGETITVSLEASTGTIDPIVSFGWKELF